MAEVSGEEYRRDLFSVGVAVNYAFSAPKQLKSLLQPPGQYISNDEVEGMLKIPGRNNRGSE